MSVSGTRTDRTEHLKQRIHDIAAEAKEIAEAGNDSAGGTCERRDRVHALLEKAKQANPTSSLWPYSLRTRCWRRRRHQDGGEAA